MRVTSGIVLWGAALAVFVIGIASPYPVAVMDQRGWMEILLTYGGFVAAAVALAGNVPLGLFGIWAVGALAAHRSPASFQTVMMILCALGLYRVARISGQARRVLVALAGLNAAALGLQAAGWWEPAVRYYGGSVEVFNVNRVLTGLTPSSADLGCVLAMALPFVPGWWALPVAAALLATQASSAIVAGFLGLGVAYWPRLKRTGFVGFVGFLMVLGLTVNVVDGIVGVLTDDRWRLWGYTLRDWFGAGPAVFLFGSGWGTARAGLVNGRALDRFDQLHFEALQLGIEAGLVGLLLGLAAFGWYVRRAVWAGNRAALGGLAALAACQFGHFPLHLASGGVVVALLLADADTGHE